MEAYTNIVIPLHLGGGESGLGGSPVAANAFADVAIALCLLVRAARACRKTGYLTPLNFGYSTC